MLFLQNYPWLFPFYFVGIWLLATVVLSLKSHWFGLMRAFPNREEMVSLQLRGLTGNMGGVGMRGILNVSVCPSGLRVGINRIFGPFSRDFFVPWEQLSVVRKNSFWGNTATLQFGSPRIGWIRLQKQVADELARSAKGRWPEVGDFAPENRSDIFSSVFREWLICTTVASLFFTLAPRIMSPNQDSWPPIEIAILFPATVFGIAALVKYLSRVRRSKNA